MLSRGVRVEKKFRLEFRPGLNFIDLAGGLDRRLESQISPKRTKKKFRPFTAATQREYKCVISFPYHTYLPYRNCQEWNAHHNYHHDFFGLDDDDRLQDNKIMHLSYSW